MDRAQVVFCRWRQNSGDQVQLLCGLGGHKGPWARLSPHPALPFSRPTDKAPARTSLVGASLVSLGWDDGSALGWDAHV